MSESLSEIDQLNLLIKERDSLNDKITKMEKAIKLNCVSCNNMKSMLNIEKCTSCKGYICQYMSYSRENCANIHPDQIHRMHKDNDIDKYCKQCALMYCSNCKALCKKYTKNGLWSNQLCEKCIDLRRCEYCSKWIINSRENRCELCYVLICINCSTNCGKLDHGRLCDKSVVDYDDNSVEDMTCYEKIHNCKECKEKLHHMSKEKHEMFLKKGKSIGMKSCTSETCRERCDSE